MSEQSGPDWWQGSDGHWYHPPQGPRTYTPNPQGDDPKKKRRTFGEWVSTTQGIVTIIVGLVTLIFGTSGFAIVHYFHRNPAPTPTVSQVRAALLTSSDLASIDTNLIANDEALISPISCNNNKVTPGQKVGLTRVFKDGSNLWLTESIGVFDSPGDAHTDFESSLKGMACSLVAYPHALSNISTQLNGLCDEHSAWKAAVTLNNGVIDSAYFGLVRCGQFLVNFQLLAVQGSSYDSESNFVSGMQLALPKIQGLP